MKELDSNAQIKENFYITTTRDLETELKNLKLEKRGFLAWGEFIELLFNHKRNVKPAEKERAAKKIREKKQTSESEKKLRPLEAIDIWKNSNLKSYEITVDDYKKHYKPPPKKTSEQKFTVPRPFAYG